MDHVYSTTETTKKGSHLSYEERVIIEIRLKDGKSPNKIAQELGRASNTIRNEIKRGTVTLYNGHVQRYKAKAGQETYEKNRQACGRHFDLFVKKEFIAYVEQHFYEDKWSLDACHGKALESGKFSRKEVVCPKTLYSYVGLGLIGIRNHNLPEKLHRKAKTKTTRENKKKLGRSIEERPKTVETREEFGHWEADLVLGQKSGQDKTLLTLAERKTRQYWMIVLENREADTVINAFNELKSIYSEHFSEVFKTITTDNGSEFSRLAELEERTNTKVYFTHPYTSCEKGTNERHNGIIRRFVPKGKRIDDFSAEDISNIEVWCNSLPRKILGYRTPDEAFEDELDLIYQKNAA